MQIFSCKQIPEGYSEISGYPNLFLAKYRIYHSDLINKIQNTR
jgi:hypothetical protein